MHELETGETISQREKSEVQTEETCMSEEEFEKLEAGDTVVVRDLDDLIAEYGGDISGIPCGWAGDMDDYCGTTLYIETKCDICILAFENGFSWSRQMLKPNSSSPHISDSEIQDLWSQMILGNKGDL